MKPLWELEAKDILAKLIIKFNYIDEMPLGPNFG